MVEIESWDMTVQWVKKKMLKKESWVTMKAEADDTYELGAFKPKKDNDVLVSLEG